ncbi:MAG: hypothetical protein ACK55Z_36290, partial [bacterium]
VRSQRPNRAREGEGGWTSAAVTRDTHPPPRHPRLRIIPSEPRIATLKLKASAAFEKSTHWSLLPQQPASAHEAAFPAHGQAYT